MKRDPLEVIQEALTQEELLCQLAEEAAELSQAALKLRRAYDGTNPTPKSRKECMRPCWRKSLTSMSASWLWSLTADLV